MNLSLTTIPKLKFSEPRHNLPGRKGVATPEDLFTIAFMRAYLDQAKRVHHKSKRTQFAFAREIPVNGYGIADLLVIAWEKRDAGCYQDTEEFLRIAQPCSRAFECKLTDWRKGMSQASRYKFFANQAIMVLPPDTCRRALPYLETLKKIKVGLWEFSQESKRIIVHHTPRQSTPVSERYYIHSIECVSRASRLALPIPEK